MIVSRCDTLIDLLGRLKAAQTDRSLSASLGPRRDELQGRLDRLTQSACGFRVLRDDGVARPIGLPEVADFPATVAAVKGRLEADPFKVTAGRDYKSAIEALDSSTERLRVHAADGWREWLDRNRARIDAAELDRAERVPGFAAVAAEVRSLQSEAVALDGRSPANAAGLAARVVLAALRERIAGLPRPENAEVRTFLDAANAPDGASLDLLTPQVVQWLKSANGLYAHYRVVVR